MSGPGAQAKDRQANATRNSRTGASGNANRDGAGGGGARASVAPGGNQYAGYRGPIGTNTPTSAAPGSYGLSGSETRQYNAAKDEFASRTLPRRVFDFLSPIHAVDPQINQPASYAAGQYHHGFNPIGATVGTLAPFGSGTILGPLAGMAANNAGLHDVVVTGPGSSFSTSYPDGGPGYNSSTGYAGPQTPSSPQGKGNQGGDFGSFVMPKPSSLNAGNGQLAQAPSFAPNIQPAGSGVKGPTNLAELLQTLQKPAPQSLTQFMGVL